MKPFRNDATVNTTNLQQGELIHMYLSFYNVTSIRGFYSITTSLCENNIILWPFPTASKQALVHIIHFILTTLKN